MTIYGQILGVFKRENNECIRNGEKTNLHKIKNVAFLFIIREVNSDMPIYILNRTNAGKNQMPRAVRCPDFFRHLFCLIYR